MQTKPAISRRDFLQGMAVAAAVRKWSTAFCLWARTSSPGREKLSLFSYSDVKLTGGPLRSQQERINASYQGLDEDRLLKVYRQRAGLPAPGEDMGGWYDANGFGPGQVLGQIISGLSRFYRSTGDVTTQAKVKTLVEGFAATVDSEGYCFPCLKSSTAYPSYTLDKIMIGLEDAYNFAGVSPALDALERCIAGAIRYLPLRAYERFEAPRQANIDESYTLPENLSIELRLEVAAPSEFTIYVRIPGWLKSPAQLAVNDKAVTVAAEPRTFAALRRRWQTNDSVQIRLPFSFWSQPLDPQHPNTAALMWGPLMLVALDPPLALPKKAGATFPEGLRASPYSPLTFEVSREAEKLPFVPFYRIRDEVYTTYVQQKPA